MRVEVDQIEGRRFRIRAREVEAIVDDTIESGGPGDIRWAIPVLDDCLHGSPHSSRLTT